MAVVDVTNLRPDVGEALVVEEVRRQATPHCEDRRTRCAASTCSLIQDDSVASHRLPADFETGLGRKSGVTSDVTERSHRSSLLPAAEAWETRNGVVVRSGHPSVRACYLDVVTMFSVIGTWLDRRDCHLRHRSPAAEVLGIVVGGIDDMSVGD